MKKKWNGLIILIVGTIFACVLLTFIIVKICVYRHDMKSSTREPVEVLFDNAYIVSQDNGKITILYHGMVNTFIGEAEADCVGVADIKVKNGKITEIISKKQTDNGNLIKYKKGIMYVEKENGKTMELEYVSEFPVYSFTTGEVKQISTNDLVLGASQLEYVIANGKVCALIQRETSSFENIRVLMKHGDEVYYEQKVHIEKDGEESYIADEEGKRLTRNCIGTLEVLEEEKGYVVVNTLPVEDYVRYVTPSEMPANWDLEALKAQAVCARTYAYAQMKNDEYAAFGANLDNTVSYQVYNNTELTEATDRAAEETKYQVLANNNHLITCYFFSTCAGKTNTMEVWDSQNPDFIHSVESKDESSSLYEWDAVLDLTVEDSNKLGEIKNIKIQNRNSGGYITELIIEYEKGIRSYKSEYKIRSILAEHMISLFDGSGRDLKDWTLLPSAAFDCEEKEDGTLAVSGSGYGHGIGLSQQGAGDMAKAGATYEEILKYYYANVELIDIRQLFK